MKRKIFLLLYYGFATHLPDSYIPIVGTISNRLRVWCCKHIFRACGNISTIGRHVYFGTGRDVEIGDYSGLGANAHIPNNTIIGKYVITAPDLHIVTRNHHYTDPGTPICFQGAMPMTHVEIYDNVWIGQRVIILPGRIISSGTVVGAGSVVTKNFPPESVIAGNPARFIKWRIEPNN